MVPPQTPGDDWTASFGWQSDNVGRATTPLSYKTLKSGKQVLSIAFGADKAPTITGRLRFVVSAWNA